MNQLSRMYIVCIVYIVVQLGISTSPSLSSQMQIGHRESTENMATMMSSGGAVAAAAGADAAASAAWASAGGGRATVVAQSASTAPRSVRVEALA